MAGRHANGSPPQHQSAHMHASIRSIVIFLAPLAAFELAAAQCEHLIGAADANMSDARFGESVDISGHHALVGSFKDFAGSTTSGSAYFFEYTASSTSGGGWEQVDMVWPEDGQAADWFGRAVAISGDRAVVGAPGASATSVGSGAAYLYERRGARWEAVQKLTTDVMSQGSNMGWPVALHGDVVLLGARFDNQLADDAGAVFVFEYDGAGWVHTAKLLASDGAEDDQFGVSVAVSDDRILVGARNNGTNEQGAAYLFERGLLGWVEVHKFEASDAASGDYFGSACDIDGDVVVVGAYGDNQHGAAYVYELAGQDWAETKLVPDDIPGGSFFGSSVSISGDLILGGSNRDDVMAFNSGSATLFERQPAGWTQVLKVAASDGFVEQNFGQSVALSGDWCISGTPEHFVFGNYRGSGAAYLFAVGRGERYCTSSPNSTGAPASISIEGCLSVLDGELELVATQLPASVPGIFFYGDTPQSAPLGEGTLCVRSNPPGPYRLQVQLSSPAGVLQYPFDFAAAAGIPGEVTAGSTWYFQAYYRDVLGGASGFNLSDGIALPFVP